MAGIYIHIPFCKQACHYCDFHFSTVLKSKDEVVAAIIRETELQKDYLKGQDVATLYFGGGTPSLLSWHDLDKILNTVGKHFRLSDRAEVTLEANPDDLTPEKLGQLRKLGINRLSIGIQTFNDEYLQYLNRAHDASMAISCIENARKAQFENISIDLIYGIKDDTHEVLTHDLKTAVSLTPEHISAYCLTIEPKTAFGNWLKKKRITQVSEDFAAEEFELLLSTLEANGYEQYEISNFAKPPFYSQHNSSYWRHIPYLGLGPSAHSFNGHSRQFNLGQNAAYVKSISNGVVPCQIETLSAKNLANELIMTGLRTKWGCDLSHIRLKYGFDLNALFASLLQAYTRRGLMYVENDTLLLTKKGKLLADEISENLMLI